VELDGWPTQARVWLEWGSSVSHSLGDVTTQGPSTPQIIAFAMICSGRDDRVGGNLNTPSQTKTRLGWATRTVGVDNTGKRAYDGS